MVKKFIETVESILTMAVFLLEILMNTRNAKIMQCLSLIPGLKWLLIQDKSELEILFSVIIE